MNNKTLIKKIKWNYNSEETARQISSHFEKKVSVNTHILPDELEKETELDEYIYFLENLKFEMPNFNKFIKKTCDNKKRLLIIENCKAVDLKFIKILPETDLIEISKEKINVNFEEIINYSYIYIDTRNCELIRKVIIVGKIKNIKVYVNTKQTAFSSFILGFRQRLNYEKKSLRRMCIDIINEVTNITYDNYESQSSLVDNDYENRNLKHKFIENDLKDVFLMKSDYPVLKVPESEYERNSNEIILSENSLKLYLNTLIYIDLYPEKVVHKDKLKECIVQTLSHNLLLGNLLHKIKHRRLTISLTIIPELGFHLNAIMFQIQKRKLDSYSLYGLLSTYLEVKNYRFLDKNKRIILNEIIENFITTNNTFFNSLSSSLSIPCLVSQKLNLFPKHSTQETGLTHEIIDNIIFQYSSNDKITRYLRENKSNYNHNFFNFLCIKLTGNKTPWWKTKKEIDNIIDKSNIAKSILEISFSHNPISIVLFRSYISQATIKSFLVDLEYSRFKLNLIVHLLDTFEFKFLLDVLEKCSRLASDVLDFLIIDTCRFILYNNHSIQNFVLSKSSISYFNNTDFEPNVFSYFISIYMYPEHSDKILLNLNENRINYHESLNLLLKLQNP